MACYYDDCYNIKFLSECFSDIIPTISIENFINNEGVDIPTNVVEKGEEEMERTIASKRNDAFLFKRAVVTRKIFRAGNSLAIALPREIVESLGRDVLVMYKDGRVILKPFTPSFWLYDESGKEFVEIPSKRAFEELLGDWEIKDYEILGKDVRLFLVREIDGDEYEQGRVEERAIILRPINKKSFNFILDMLGGDEK